MRRSLRGQRPVLAAPPPAVALRAARLHDHLAGPALRHFEASLKVCERFAFARRAYHFPSTSSLSIALSSDRSATSFLSRPFSVSSFLEPLDRLLFGSAVFLSPSVVSRRADFQLLADLLHALASGQQRRGLAQLLDDLFSGVLFAFHVESSAALSRRQLS